MSLTQQKEVVKEPADKSTGPTFNPATDTTQSVNRIPALICAVALFVVIVGYVIYKQFAA